ncbi:MAG: NADPH-dependent F420 reductase [Planctomycetes bacterium]|nr:NADPH-dependent F420 reductase [Planctomycetota bacterium]
MHLAILGAGNVGRALATAWMKKGHVIRFGVRNPQDADLAAFVREASPRISAHDNASAVAGADVVVLATPWSSARAALASCGELDGKTIIDCTNPLRSDLSGLEIGLTTSGAEQLAAAARGAFVFKAFNQTGAENMQDQRGYAAPLAMFVAGDDAPRKATVLQLVRDAGFAAIDAGPLTAARLLEPLAMLWIHLAFRMGRGRDFGLALLDRKK